MADTVVEAIYVQNDTTPGVSGASCQGYSDSLQGVVHRGMQVGGTAGSTEASFLVDKASGIVRVMQFLSPAFTNATVITGASQVPTFRLNVTTGDVDVELRRITACTYTSTGTIHGSLYHAPSTGTFGAGVHPLTAGVKTINGTQSTGSTWDTIPAGGFIGISIIVENTAAHSDATIGITPDQNHDIGFGYNWIYEGASNISCNATVDPLSRGNATFIDTFDHNPGSQVCGTTPDTLGTSWVALDTDCRAWMNSSGDILYLEVYSDNCSDG